MYSLSDYAAMIADDVRLDAYARALAACVRPGDVVADIGSGAMAALSMMACRLGARQVFAIEPDDVIDVSREIARVNGCLDRIVFIQDISTRVTLPAPADVVVSDLRGILPWFKGNIPAIQDARARLLAPGGRLIPQRDVVWAAPVCAEAKYRGRVSPRPAAAPFDWAPLVQLTANAWFSCRLGAEALLAAPCAWQTLDYDQVTDLDASGLVGFEVHKTANGHGLLLWFDTVLAPGVGFSNAPGMGTERIYGPALFPWPEAVPLAAGDHMEVEIGAHLIDDDYVWRWNTKVEDSSGRLKAEFRQSTFQAAALNPERLRRLDLNHRPVLSEDGEIEQFTLSLMRGNINVAAIAEALHERFPSAFATAREARARAVQLSARFGR